MSEPSRMRDRSRELDVALDDPVLDPPEGIEDAVWSRLDETLGMSSGAAAEAVSDLAAPARSTIRPVAETRFAQAKFVAGALALAAAAVLAIRSSGPRDGRGPEAPAGSIAYPPATAASVDEVAPVAPIADPSTTSMPPMPPAPTKPVSSSVSPTKAPIVTPPPVPRSTAEVAPAPVEPAPAPSVAPPPASSETTTAAPSTNALLIETSEVMEARKLVRAGNGPAALSRLTELDVRVPGGVMREERDSLRVEALVLAGRTDQAASAAAAFAEAHPRSPLLPYVRSVVSSGVTHTPPTSRPHE